MTTTTDAVLTAVGLTISGVLAMGALAWNTGRALRRSAATLLPDAGAPELEQADPGDDRLPPGFRYSQIETDTLDAQYVAIAKSECCPLGRCIACQIVDETVGGRP